jgi:hypothetical protein
MELTPIPDREAAKILNVTHATIRNAVERGALVRYPKSGKIQHVIKEQVELFIGRGRIVSGDLSPVHLQRWHEISRAVIVPPILTPRPTGDADRKVVLEAVRLGQDFKESFLQQFGSEVALLEKKNYLV